MSLGKKLHLTLALAGFGAFLLVVPAYAQQDTNPDHFYQNGVEAFQESAKPVPAHHAKAMRLRLSAQPAKARIIAANRRAFARVRSKGRTRLAGTRKQTAVKEKKMVATRRR